MALQFLVKEKGKYYNNAVRALLTGLGESLSFPIFNLVIIFQDLKNVLKTMTNNLALLTRKSEVLSISSRQA